MTPAARKLNLTAHVSSSVGWLGAVGAFLVLGIAGLISQDADTVRGAYLAMNLIGQFMIVPLSVASLTTGLVQSLGTQWGGRLVSPAVRDGIVKQTGVARQLPQTHNGSVVVRWIDEVAPDQTGIVPDLSSGGRPIPRRGCC